MPKRSLEEIKHAWNKRLYRELVLPSMKKASKQKKLAREKQADKLAQLARLNEQAMINKPFIAKVVRRARLNASEQASKREHE